MNDLLDKRETKQWTLCGVVNCTDLKLKLWKKNKFMST